ncbi:MAG: DUF4837 domain-containing protein [Ignavibacteria bacterium RBG_13_36_8]|nr:MAG: DUF4837 domain-containing protein [Ignavibacteria bacterium RBG_13_36_8]
MKKKYLGICAGSILIFTTSVIFFGCGTSKPDAIGDDDKIIVIADSVQYEELESTFLQVFSKIIYTPQPEKLFELNRRNLRDLDRLKRRKNIIITAPLDSDSDVAKYIRSLLDLNVASLVRKDSVFVMNKYDMWAKSQLVMVLTSPTTDQLRQNMLKDNENLLYYFRNISNKRLFASLYNPRYERKDVEAQLLDSYGWIIYVQADFQLALNKPENKFVWLRRSPGTDMERWIFVHWIDNSTPEFLNPDSIASERNKLTREYYRSVDDQSYVEIADDYKTTSEENFLGKYALMTEGLWRMNDKSMGGPFINYTFYDEATRRIYMLDGSIFAPKYYKKKLIQQVDVMLKSFKTKNELSEDKIDDLMDELN